MGRMQRIWWSLSSLLFVYLALIPYAAAGTAVNFDGVDDYVNLGNPTMLRLTGAMTLSAWVHIDTFTSNGRIITKQGGPGARGWSLNLESNGTVSFQVAINTNTTIDADSGPVPSGQWLHVTGVYRPGQAVELYLNGVLAVSNTTGVPASQYNSAWNVRIGRRPDGLCPFDGRIDEVRVYNRALNAAEISAQYNGGLGQQGFPEAGLVGGWHLDEGSGTATADYSGNNTTGTLTNGPTWVAGKVQSTPPPDTTPPTGSVTINSGAAATRTTAVTLTLSATDNSGAVTQMKFSNDGTTYSAAEPYATTKSWTLASGDGTKTVRAKFKDAAGNWSAAATDTIVLDTTPPVLTITSPSNGSIVTP